LHGISIFNEQEASKAKNHYINMSNHASQTCEPSLQAWDAEVVVASAASVWL